MIKKYSLFVFMILFMNQSPVLSHSKPKNWDEVQLGTQFKDLSSEGQLLRIDLVRRNINAAKAILPRIQQCTHNDPNKACDLACNMYKFLLNAQTLLE